MIAQVVEQQCPGDNTPQGRDSCLQQLTQEANRLLSDTRERSRSSIAALKSLFDRLGTSETPKTIVFVSEGLLLEPDFGDVAWIGPRSSAAHVALYVLQIDTPDMDRATGDRLRPESGSRALREGLDVMAGMARGDVFRSWPTRISLSGASQLELSGYYLLSFEPLAGDRDDRPTKSRSMYTGRTSTCGRVESSAWPAAPAGARDELVDTLRAPLLVADIPLKATTYIFPGFGFAKDQDRRRRQHRSLGEPECRPRGRIRADR